MKHLRTIRLPLLLLALHGALGATPALSATPPEGGADAVLQRYVDAVGGQARLQRPRSRLTRSVVKSGWTSVELETGQQWPDRAYESARVPVIGTRMTSGYDGSTGWAAKSIGKYRPLEGLELRQFILTHRLDRDARLLELFPSRRRLPDAQVAGAPVQVLELTTAEGIGMIWSFEKSSGRLLQTRIDAVQPDAPAPVTITTTYSDYRRVDGLWIAFSMHVAGGGAEASISVKSVADDVPLDPARLSSPLR